MRHLNDLIDTDDILNTYLALHENKVIGCHWIWAALERIAAGENEQDVLADYGYIDMRH